MIAWRADEQPYQAMVARFRAAGFTTMTANALVNEGFDGPEDLPLDYEYHRIANIGKKGVADIERYLGIARGCGWTLTPTALLRPKATPVFLQPKHWPRRMWQCG